MTIETMRAVAFDRYGPPQVLKVQQVPRPRPAEGEVLIRVYAAGVNPIDWRIRSGSLRWLWRPRLPMIPGYDISGVVAEIGPRVTRLQPGDEVFSFIDRNRAGGYAEYAVASEHVIVAKPAGISHIEAAAVPLAASTALQALRDLGQVRPGASVLVNGASGGVGTFAVQIAKALGAEVTGVSSTRNLDLVRQLGADQVVDYTRDDFTRQDRTYDVVLDAVAKSSFRASRRILKPRGRYVTTVPRTADILYQVLTRPFRGRQCLTVLAKRSADDLQQLKELIESGQVRVVIDQVFPLEQAAQAHEVSEAGHARGKLVLRVTGGQ